ncbi:MAG: GIY-YIG nuclease family protein [Anaerostipes faecalis]|nr:GIY-YIG nuclease family protein [Anaerostipes faecalis]
MKKKWYFEPWVIAIMFALWIFLIPPIIGIILLILRKRQDKQNLELYQAKEKELNDMIQFNENIGFRRYEDVTNEINKIKSDFSAEKSGLEVEIQSLKDNRDREKERLLLEVKDERDKLIASIDELNKDFLKTRDEKNQEISNLNNVIAKNNEIISELNDKIEKLKNDESRKEKQIETQTKKLSRIKELQRSVTYCINNFFDHVPSDNEIILSKNDMLESDQIAPSVILKLHSMDVKELRKAFKDNDKQINEILNQYSARYTTKANIAIYKLMVIALRSELQNILYNLKYEKLDDCIDQIKLVTSKYLKIAGDGNQSIVGTLTKFIGQIEYLFINAVKIEYNYYVKREQAKQEQQAIREQMRQEAAERKALAAEKRKIEQEESKYNAEIQKLNEQLSNAHDDELQQLQSRILELQSQLASVVVKKEEIVTLAQGKAGNVYIISNVGSFGDNVFKIGMTRRLEPQERVDELGSASVPFKFDVHSFIFSDDAVGLENKLHEILNEKRVNKVNMRKEFFRTTIDELEQIVNDIDPTAEFRRTILAEEYRQSLTEEEVQNSKLLCNSIEATN